MTGGAGIGRATAELFARAGMRIAVAEIVPERAADVRAALDAAGAESLVEVADVRRADDVARLIEAVENRFGRLDVLVNNVGYLGIKKPFEETTEEEWDALYAVNLLHMFRVSKAAIPLMRRSGAGGSIINVSTVEAFRGIPHTVVYAAFKTAITGALTQSLAVELGADGPRQRGGAGDHQHRADRRHAARSAGEPRLSEALVPHRPLRRWHPLAGRALTPASDLLSGWVTGSTIIVDGGALAAGAWTRLPDGKNFTDLPIIVADGYTPRPEARRE